MSESCGARSLAALWPWTCLAKQIPTYEHHLGAPAISMTFSVPPWLGLAKKQFSVFMSVCWCRDAGEDSTQNSGVAKKVGRT